MKKRYQGTKVSSGHIDVRKLDGVVIEPASRVAKSGNQANSFIIGSESYTIYSEDTLHPLTAGDQVSFHFEIRHYQTGSRKQYNAVVEDSLEILAPASIADQVNGNIYIMSNSSMPGLYKIGFTTGSATDRAGALSGVTGVPTKFDVAWTLPMIGNPHAVEKRAHAILASSRHGKEFFRATLEDAQNACIQAFSETHPAEAARMGDAFATYAASAVDRRQKHEQLMEQRSAAKLRAAEQALFDQTPEGRWRLRGTTELSIETFDPAKRRGESSFLRRLVGSRNENSLDICAKMTQRGNTLIWQIVIDGWLNGATAFNSYERTDMPTMISTLTEMMADMPIQNRSVRIEIEHRYVENPPSLSVSSDPIKLDIGSAMEFLGGLSIRSEPLQNVSRRSR